MYAIRYNFCYKLGVEWVIVMGVLNLNSMNTNNDSELRRSLSLYYYLLSVKARKMMH